MTHEEIDVNEISHVIGRVDRPEYDQSPSVGELGETAVEMH